MISKFCNFKDIVWHIWSSLIMACFYWFDDFFKNFSNLIGASLKGKNLLAWGSKLLYFKSNFDGSKFFLLRVASFIEDFTPQGNRQYQSIFLLIQKSKQNNRWVSFYCIINCWFRNYALWYFIFEIFVHISPYVLCDININLNTRMTSRIGMLKGLLFWSESSSSPIRATKTLVGLRCII